VSLLQKLFKRNRIILKYRYKNGEEGQVELDKYPEYPAMQIKEILGIEDICDTFEWVRIYVNNRVKYSYPCGRRKKEEEDDITKLAKELIREQLKKSLERIGSEQQYSPKDILAQLLAEHQMSRDLYMKLKEVFEPHTAKESPFDKLMEKLLEKALERVVSIPVLQQAQQSPSPSPAPQQQQANVEALLSMLPPDVQSAIKEVVERFKSLPPEEQQKLVNEAMQYAKQLKGNFRGEAKS